MEFDYCEVFYRNFVVPDEIFDEDGYGDKTLFELLKNGVYAVEDKDVFFDRFYNYDEACKFARILAKADWLYVDNKNYILITCVQIIKMCDGKKVDIKYYGYDWH